MTSLTPWTYLAEHKDLKVVMLVSETPGADLDRPLPDPEATDAFFAPRDPSGVLRRQLEANGALTDGILDVRRVAGTPLLGPQGAGEPRLARRHAGLHPHLPERRGLEGLPGRLPEGGGEGLTPGPAPGAPFSWEDGTRTGRPRAVRL